VYQFTGVLRFETMTFIRRKHLIISGILFLLFVLLTIVLPQILISKRIIYDQTGISMKAGELAAILSWPFSACFPQRFVSSYYFLPLVFIYYLLLILALSHIHNFLWGRKLYRWISLAIFIPLAILRLNPDLLVYLDNEQPSKSLGTPGNGTLSNGKRLPFSGENFQYFNFLSYLEGNCFVHAKVKQTLIDTYKICEQTCPGIEFSVGEGSKKSGGPYVFNHRTHQNGTSMDLQLVFKKDGKPFDPLSIFNGYGYGLDTDNKGNINKSMPVNIFPKNTMVDFETNAKFLLALDDACKRNGIAIRIVILKIELKPLLFAAPSGQKLLARNIRFATALPKLLNDAHDDHFHVDFTIP
jgi:penicillin-insensitive murein DD-endopeptidase